MLTQRQIFLKNLAQTSDFPMMLDVDYAEGVYIYDTKGKKYIDLISGIGVSNVGHRHPSVVSAIKNQINKHLHVMVYGEYIQSPQTILAKKLTETLPENLQSVYFVNSGSEAVEGALKLAKRFTGKHKTCSFKNAYHGSTQGALSVCGNENLKSNFRPLVPGNEILEFNNEQDLLKIDNDTAAVIVEVVQAEAGITLPENDFLNKLKNRCLNTNTLLIIDEIQTGFGRTGSFWAFNQFGFVPDILVCAKGMGGGMPIGAFISSNKIMSCLTNNPILGHITTFGGNPVSCASSIATLDTIINENLISDIKEKEKLFHQLLKHQKIKEIRSHGLMMAVEFESFDFLKIIIQRCLEHGLITDWFLFCDNSMRIAPPLTITFEEIKKACDIILKSLD